MKSIVLNPELIDLIANVTEEGSIDSVVVEIFGQQIDVTNLLSNKQMYRIEISVESELEIESLLGSSCDSYDAHRDTIMIEELSKLNK